MSLNKTFISSVIFFILQIILVDAKGSCSIQLSPVRFKPFILTPEGKFSPSNGYTVVINDGQNVTVSCQKYNFDKYPKLSNMRVSCDDGKLTSENGNVLSSNETSCDVKIINMMKCNVKNCPADHIGLCIVYHDTNLKANIKLSEVCYNTKINRMAFAKTHMSKEFSVEDYKMDPSERLDEFFEKISIMRHLIGSEDENRLNLLLADDHQLNYDYVTVHKAIPNGLFNEQLQDVEKYPINNVGIWKSIADGNVRRTVDDIKNYIKSKNDRVDLIFGTHQTLTTHDGNVLYFHKKVELMPQYFWAIVYEKKSRNGVAIVTINDPFASINQVKNQAFCKSICNEIPWLDNLKKYENYERPAMGYTFCCALKDFTHIYNV